MKVIAYYAIHYGKEWLYHSIKSVIDYVDEVRVYYTPNPSHGHTTKLKNPDSINELLDICRQFGVVWSEEKPRYRWEGEQRDHAVRDCFNNGADIVMVVDADEIWDPTHLDACLQYVKSTDAAIYRVGMRHFWRSVNWVCNDDASPVRFIKIDKQPKELYVGYGLVNHFGYAQSAALVRYKESIHGHKNEWRPYWYEDKFLNWRPGIGDVHPTCENGFWNPEPFDKTTIAHLIGDHPYYNVELIR